MENNDSSSKLSYVYQVELLIEETSDKKALEKLIHELNRCELRDYRIVSGIRLGEEIQKRKETLTASPVPVSMQNNTTGDDNGWGTLRSLHASGKLIRLLVNKGMGVKLSLPCRIINLDEPGNLVTIYHVDEKQVYTFLLTEIEEIIQQP